MRVARREREAVVVAHGRNGADLDIEIEIAHDLLHDRELLGVLATEVRSVRAYELEELHADRRNPAEVAGPMVALEAFRCSFGDDPGCEALRIELAGCRSKEQVDARCGSHALVVREIAGISVEVGGLAELRRVDEQARDDDVGVGARGCDQREVAVVQRSHRWHEGDRAPVAQGRERVAQLGDRSQRLHVGSSSSRIPGKKKRTRPGRIAVVSVRLKEQYRPVQMDTLVGCGIGRC